MTKSHPARRKTTLLYHGIPLKPIPPKEPKTSRRQAKKFPKRRWAINISYTELGFSADMVRAKHNGVCQRAFHNVGPCVTMKKLMKELSAVAEADEMESKGPFVWKRS